MVIHLYTFVYNEEKILPHFFKYYEKFADKFFIYDNNSTDNTKKIVKNRKDTQYLQYDTDNKFDEFELTSLRNSEWKKSSKDADWIIVCDADEFLYFDNISILKKLKGYSVIKPYGYGMISNRFPKKEKLITNQIKKGSRAMSLDKPIMFNPKLIDETNFSLGSHYALFEGQVKVYSNNKIKLLHYKNLGLEYSLLKKNLLNKRVPKKYVEMGISKHYSAEDKNFIKGFKSIIKNSKNII